jgi:Kef-type K+ transport system membrane component KefB
MHSEGSVRRLTVKNHSGIVVGETGFFAPFGFGFGLGFGHGFNGLEAVA